MSTFVPHPPHPHSYGSVYCTAVSPDVACWPRYYKRTFIVTYFFSCSIPGNCITMTIFI